MKRKQSAETGEETDSSDDYKSEGPKLPKSPFFLYQEEKEALQKGYEKQSALSWNDFCSATWNQLDPVSEKEIKYFFSFFQIICLFFPFCTICYIGEERKLHPTTWYFAQRK